MIFSVSIKENNENGKKLTYKIKFTDSVRFMLSSLSSLPDNFPKGFHKDKCKGCKSHLEYITVNENYKNNEKFDG